MELVIFTCIFHSGIELLIFVAKQQGSMLAIKTNQYTIMTERMLNHIETKIQSIINTNFKSNFRCYTPNNNPSSGPSAIRSECWWIWNHRNVQYFDFRSTAVSNWRLPILMDTIKWNQSFHYKSSENNFHKNMISAKRVSSYLIARVAQRKLIVEKWISARHFKRKVNALVQFSSVQFVLFRYFPFT